MCIGINIRDTNTCTQPNNGIVLLIVIKVYGIPILSTYFWEMYAYWGQNHIKTTRYDNGTLS